MKNFETFLVTIPVKKQKGTFIQVKARKASEGDPFYACIEAAMVNDCAGNINAKPFLSLIADVFCCKQYGDRAVGVMDTDCARWGEIGVQMFSDCGRRKARYPLGNVLALDPFASSDPFVDIDTVFTPAFDMEAFMAAMLTAVSNFLPAGETNIDYCVFFGNEDTDNNAQLWISKLRRTANTRVLFIDDPFVSESWDCHIAIWDHNKFSRLRKETQLLTCIDAPWKENAGIREGW